MKLKCPKCGVEVEKLFFSLDYWIKGTVKCRECGVQINIHHHELVEDSHAARRSAPSTDMYSNTSHVGDGEILSGCFYAVAVLVGIGLGITTIAVIGNGGSAEEIGFMIGYTIGGVLSILATGRLIELVRRISDDVRAIRERTDSQK
ncbi:MAG: hypothetical protein HOB73_17355 [Planctomycetaceae bacterium]|jgi:hypothetical protein|nr:hypothetical protein [Planctomycetaceae bacterium]